MTTNKPPTADILTFPKDDKPKESELLAALRQFYPHDDDATLLWLLSEQTPEQASELRDMVDRAYRNGMPWAIEARRPPH